MNKLIAVVLSISLIFGSITPSLAQSNKLIKGGAKALQQTGKEVLGNQVTNISKSVKQAAGAAAVSRSVQPTKQVPLVSPTPISVDGSVEKFPLLEEELPNLSNLGDNVKKEIIEQTLNKRITPKSVKEIRQMLGRSDLSLHEAQDLYNQIFNVTSRSVSAKEFLLLDAFPTVTVRHHFAVGSEYVEAAVNFYRRSLLASLQKPVSFSESLTLEELAALSSKTPEFSQLVEWSKSMAAVSNLGFYGSVKDAALLLDVYKHTPAILKPITEVVVGRALLNLEAYDALGQLAKEAAAKGNLAGDFWSGLQTYAKQEGLNLSLPTVTTIPTPKTLTKLQKVLGAWNELNVQHLDPSAQATAKWVSLNAQKGRVISLPLTETVASKPEAVNAVKPIAAAPKLELKVDEVDLSLSALNFSSSVGESAGVSGTISLSSSSEFANIIARVNSRYPNTAYAKEVSQALQYSLEKAERKFIQEYGRTPELNDPVFQKLWVTSVKPELTKLANGNRKIKTKIQDDVVSTLEASFDPANIITPIEKVSIVKRAVQYFRDRSDRKAAAKANRIAQEASIKGLKVTYPVSLEITPGVFVPEDYEFSLIFENESAKKAFLDSTQKLDSETFIIDSKGSLLLRAPSGAVRGIMDVRMEGGNEATQQVFRVLASRKLAPRFEAEIAKGEDAALALLTEVRVPLRTILPPEMLAQNKGLDQFLVAKDVEAAKIALKKSGRVLEYATGISQILKDIVAVNASVKDFGIKIFTDKAGNASLLWLAFTEGLSSFGQALTAALALFGIDKSFWATVPTAAGQVGPALAPFISGLQSKYGLKKTAYMGLALSAAGMGISAASLVAGAMGAMSPMASFIGMVAGILINGVAGNGIIKQTNVPLSKTITNDPVSASSLAARLNSWASAGGMYCYLFLPIVGAATSLLFGIQTGLGTLAAMFTTAAAAPIASALLLKISKIKNIKERKKTVTGEEEGYWKGIGKNLKFAFKGTYAQELQQQVNEKAAKKGVLPEEIKVTPWMKWKAFRSQYLVEMARRVFWYHFAGMAFNSGPGAVLKDVFKSPEKAMLASFLAVYLTVFLGRKIGAKAIGKGWITDKALIALSSLIAVGAGGLSILPGLNILERSSLWAVAGLGFANLANQEQAMALNRPENAGQRPAVSMIYVLARLSAILTLAYGALSDTIANTFNLSTTEGAIYGLAFPVAATLWATWMNRSLVTKDLKQQIKRWMTKKPKTLNYQILRQEVESAITKNPNLGMTLEEDKNIIQNLGDGLMSRYRVDLKILEETMIAVNDKAALDLYRLDMARKLYDRLPENTRLATGNPLTYAQFRQEVEPLYNSVVKARAMGATEENVDKLIHDFLTGIMAKYPVGRSDVRVIETRLMEKTRLDRMRIATMKYLYSKQLTKEAEAEIANQLKKASEDMDKQAIINHVLEKYQAMAKARGVAFNPPSNAAL